MGAERRAGNPGLAADRANPSDELSFDQYASAFARVIHSPATQFPLIFGIFGDWGTGKTTLMKGIRDRLKVDPKATSAQITIYPVWFNAWEYNAQSVIWPGMVRKVVEQVEASLWPDSLERFLRHLVRRIAEPYQRGDPRAAGGLLFALVFLMIAAVFNWGPAWWLTALSMVVATQGFAKEVAGDVGEWFRAAVQGRAYGQPIPQMEEAKRDLEALNTVLERTQARVVVFIDDLDRCDPKKAVEVLEAVHLLTDSLERAVVCLGIDPRVIVAAIEQHYERVFKASGINGEEYLEKIIQVPFTIPVPSGPEMIDYMKTLVGEESESEGELDDSLLSPVLVVDEAIRFDLQEQEALKAAVPYMDPNPRRVKRLVNTYVLLRALLQEGSADARHLAENVNAIIRFLILCERWPTLVTDVLGLLRFELWITDSKREFIPGVPKEAQFELVPGLSDQDGDALRSLVQRALGVETAPAEDQVLISELVASEAMQLRLDDLKLLARYAINFVPALEKG